MIVTDGPPVLPCPFCGEPAVVKKNKTVMVNCSSCTAATFQRLEDAESAIRDWNYRYLDNHIPHRGA
jgi:Lar family restriction alleviation protein